MKRGYDEAPRALGPHKENLEQRFSLGLTGMQKSFQDYSVDPSEDPTGSYNDIQNCKFVT